MKEKKLIKRIILITLGVVAFIILGSYFFVPDVEKEVARELANAQQEKAILIPVEFKTYFQPDKDGLARPYETYDYNKASALLAKVAGSDNKKAVEKAFRKASTDDKSSMEDEINIGSWHGVINSLFGTELETDNSAPLMRNTAAGDILNLIELSTPAEEPSNESQTQEAEKKEYDKRYYPDLYPDEENYALSVLISSSPRTMKEYKGMTVDGYLWLSGHMYRLGEDGYFKRDYTDGFLAFDKNGRYTSGDEDLDELTAAFIAERMTDEETTRLDMLKVIYKFVRDEIKYVGFNNNEEYGWSDPDAVGWGVECAKTALGEGIGNCYYYSSCFAHLARAIGYQAFIVPGCMGMNYDPHCWCEIEQDDTVYYCDPELEWSRAHYQHDYVDLFFVSWQDAIGWMYNPNTIRDTSAKRIELQGRGINIDQSEPAQETELTLQAPEEPPQTQPEGEQQPEASQTPG